MSHPPGMCHLGHWGISIPPTSSRDDSLAVGQSEGSTVGRGDGWAAREGPS